MRATVGNGEGVIASEPAHAHGREHAITLTLPPLAALILTPVNE